ncbi:GTP-binding protein [Actinokineospora sp. NPDC004072]
MTSLNLGILAHVDAGKTSLTERLLHTAGAIERIGSVDRGDTQTDSLALERRRGITIRSAVAAFTRDGVAVNLIDTPGHPDFIAEVERVLAVLDGAVLVLSAVEGVQAQTRLLMRTLRRLRIPTLLFINKIDRAGADTARTLAAIADKLDCTAVAMGTTHGEGGPGAGFAPGDPADPGFAARLADVLTRADDALLADWLGPEPVPGRRLVDALAEQTSRVLVHPVYAGSAITGAGVDALMSGITRLLPAAGGDPDDPPSGLVFKIERGAAGERVAYARMYAGTVRVRERLPGHASPDKITGITVYDGGPARRSDRLAAGEIGALRGLAGVRVGDRIGAPAPGRARHSFAPPTLETVVSPLDPAAKGALHAALSQLADQDPLIGLRHDPVRQEISVSLYGEVQKEVIEATLAEEHGIAVAFSTTTTLCVERPDGAGAAVELIGADSNPFLATVGLRVEPGPGPDFRLGVELGSMPAAFFRAVEEAVTETLREGLHGWPVVDWVVTMTHSGYWARQSHAHGTFDKSMSSTAGDFRNLTPLVLMDALRRAGTTVHEPVHGFLLELPPDTVEAALPALTRGRGVPLAVRTDGRVSRVEGEIPAAEVHRFQQRLPALTRGEGVMETEFRRYLPVRGPVPERSRTDQNPLCREEYLLHVVRRV